jgi:branched-chain amino acid aminotransferase
VGEGSGENIFLVKDDTIHTPSLAGGILEGITRNSVIRIARDLGYEIVERDITRTELAMADELFVTGTAAEVAAIREVDDHPVGTGSRGPVTAELQRVFEDAIRGREPRYAEWLDHVEVPAPAH